MPEREQDNPIHRLRRTLIDPNIGVVPSAMLDCAAHMLLYFDDVAAAQRIALEHLSTRFSAARTDLGFGSASAPVYRASASVRHPGCDIPDMLGRELPNLDRGIQVVWQSDHAVAIDVKSEPFLNRLRPTMLALGMRSKLARRLEYRDQSFGIVCIDRTDSTCAWTDADRCYLDQFVVTFMSPILAESRGSAVEREGARLTEAERAVARLAISGCSYKEIAAALGKSPNTVDNQLRQMRAKLAVRNQVELVRACLSLVNAQPAGSA